MNATVFTVGERLLISPLTVRDAEALVSLGRLSYPNYESFADRLPGLSGMAGFFNQRVTLTGERAETIRATFVTGKYFEVLGVSAIVGSVDGDGGLGGAVLSEGFWRRAYAGDPGVVGRTVSLNGVGVAISGVAAAGFRGTDLEYLADLWVPLSSQWAVRSDLRRLRGRRTSPWLRVFGRRSPGVSFAQVELVAGGIWEQLVAEYPGDNGEVQPIDVVPLTQAAFSPAKRRSLVQVLVLLQLAALSVFLIGAANVTILVLVSAESRQRGWAIRLMLGGRWWQVARQQAVEYLLLGGVGGVGGVLVGRASLRMLEQLGVLGLPPGSGGVDAYTVALVVGLCAAVPIAAVVLSAVRVRGREESVGLQRWEGRRGATARAWLMKAFVAVQVACSLAVVCGALLFVENLQGKIGIQPGFRPEGVVRVGFAFRDAGYDESTASAAWRGVIREVETKPGVRDASWALSIPFDGVGFVQDVTDGSGAGGKATLVRYNEVDQGFFALMGIPVVRGRGFTQDDRGRPVAVVSQGLASRLWAGEGAAVGGRLRTVYDNRILEVVGVVGDVRYSRLDHVAEPMAYFPGDSAFLDGYLLMRAEPGVPATVAWGREVVRRLDLGAAHDVRTMREVVDAMLGQDRFVAAGVGVFGALGLLLLGLGVYGSVLRLVGLRHREMAVRLALGAERRQIFLDVLMESGLVLGAGMVGGLAMVSGYWRVVESQVYGISTTGMVGTLGQAVFVVGAVGLVSSAVAGRLAMAVDPAVTLRRAEEYST